MPFTDEQLRGRAQAIVNTMKSVSTKERQQEPSDTFVENYNAFRKLVLEAHADLERLIPSSIPLDDDITFLEIQSYCEEIIAALPGTKETN